MALFADRQRRGELQWILLEALRRSLPARLLLGSAKLVRGAVRALTRDDYRALDDLCTVHRVARIPWLSAAVRPVRDGVLQRTCLDGARPRPARRNTLLDSFMQSREAREWKAWNAEQSDVRRINLGGDLMLLKTPDPESGELGVLLLKYNTAFNAFAALYDVPAVLADYQLVLEPSWVGYAVPDYYLFVDDTRRVVVQAPLSADYDYIEALRLNLVPVRTGAGYWVDDAVFRPLPGVEKKYAAIMVANWMPFKRHRLLLRSLRDARDPALRVALVGYPWGGYDRSWIERLVDEHGVRDQVEVFERLSPEQLNALYNQACANVLLSKREGASKVLYEGFFADVPAIVTARHESVNLADVNEMTGVQVEDSDLVDALRSARERLRSFRPREWAAGHVDSRVSLQRVETALCEASRLEGRPWRRPLAAKVNRPALRYADPEIEREMLPHYRSLARYLKSPVRD